MKKCADKLVVGDVLASGDLVVGVELVGNMVELDIELHNGGGEGVSVVVPCFEEFGVIA